MSTASTSTVAAVPAAHTLSASSSSSPSASSPVTNPIDDFFGSSTRESRHDHENLNRLSIGNELPSYQSLTIPPPPEYTPKADPVTLAMYLFKFGFLFPPFWILGALILLSPLRAPESSPVGDDLEGGWMPEKTEAEREALLAYLRKAEMKWARRCLIALIVLVTVGVAAGVAAFAIQRA